MDDEIDIYIPEGNEVAEAPVDTTLQTASDIDPEETNTYKWSGAQLRQEVGICVPIVYGRHIVAGNLINAFIEEGENETLNMLIALCEGEVESISNVMINRSPIENYYGNNPADPYGRSADVTVRTGTVGQEPIENFGDLHNYYNVSERLLKGVPYIYSGAEVDTEAFIIEFSIDKLYQLDENQNSLSWYMSYHMEYKLSTDMTWINMGIYEIDKKTTTLFKRYVKSDYLAPGKYDIRVTKLSDDADNTSYFGDITLVTVDEVKTENLAYPSTALMGLRLLAIQNLQGNIPNVTCVVTGRKIQVPKIVYTPSGNDLVDWDDYYYDPAQDRWKTLWNEAVVNWDGTSYVEAWSGNPVWCLRDLLLNDRYGLGQWITSSDLDESSFLSAAKYCDEGVNNSYGKLEKRFMLDIVFDNDMQASDVIAQLLKSFRGMIDTSSGKIRVSIEKEGDPVYLFTVGNIIKNSFSMKYLSTKISNIVSMQFANVDKNWQMDRVEIGDEEAIKRGDAFRSTNLQLIGCTRVTQAMREGTIYLKKLKANRLMISFKSYVEAILIQPNDIFSFQHEMPAWGDGGRVQDGSTTTVVVLDKEVTIEQDKTYELMIKNGENDEIETRTVALSVGVYSSILVTTPFSFIPKEYDVWALGIVQKSIQQYRATSVRKSSDGTVDISAIQYTAAVYDPTTMIIPIDDEPYLSLEIPDVLNLNLREKVTRNADGSILSQIEVSFQKPTESSKWVKIPKTFEIHLSDNDGASWNLVGLTDKEYYLITESLRVNRLYTVAVVSVAENGDKNLPSTSPRQNITLFGWQGAPIKVQNLVYTFTNEVALAWDRNPEMDVVAYEVRLTDYDWGTNNEAMLFRGNATTFTHLHPFLRNSVLYYVRAVNSAGIYSPESSIVEPINTPPGVTVLRVVELFQKAFLSWDVIQDTDMQYYEIWRNSEDAWYGEEQGNEELVQQATGIQCVVEVPHNPTYFRIRGNDKFGGGAWSNVVVAYQTQIGSGDIGNDVILAQHIQALSIASEHITANAILAQHIAANQITAEHLAVDTLSALSANIGKVIAGEIVGVRIKTSEDAFRTELDQTGLYSYNTDGTLVVKLTQGQLCLIDPTCCEFYSLIDAGQIKFHTPYGTLPFLKRIASGVVSAGGEVTLCQWYESPHIIVALKKLTSYDAAFCAQSQGWCVYSDNVRAYNNGGGDFGYKFDVHAKLALAGGTYAECVYNIPFGTYCYTHACVCMVIVKEDFQVWCNQQAPAPYEYGQVCFEIKYRKLGCGVWCSCSYVYDQPHATAEDILYTHRVCQTVAFASAGCYEVMPNLLTVNYITSSIESGGWECRLCQFQYSIDYSFWLSCIMFQTLVINHSIAASSGGPCTVSDGKSWIDVLTFSQFKGGEVSKGKLYYTITGSVASHTTGSNAGAGGSIRGQYGGGLNTGETRYEQNSFITGVAFTTDMSASARGSQYTVELYRGGGTLITERRFKSSSASAYLNAYVSACEEICFKCCKICYYWCCYWYKVWCGVPQLCCSIKWYSMTDISGQECIIDPAGEVSYLAVAYT